MKKLSVFLLTILMIMGHQLSLSGQKIMKLDNDLKNNSTPLVASRKGISAVAKYEFGPYKIISGKAGWKSTNSTQRFFNFETKSESKSKSSFVFLANQTDTIQVNISLNTKAIETDFEEFSYLNQSNDNFIAIISSNSDTTAWRMVVVASSGEDVKGHFQAEGTLTNGTKNFAIRTIKLLENGKKLLMNANCGFEFVIDDKVVAAVQTSVDVSLKKTVWLESDLDNKTKSLLAAASASLMIYTDYLDSEL
jgi:hypothetical protein